METTTPVYPTTPTTVVATPTRTAPVSWGAIFAGAFVAVGVWMLLHLLGMGIGLTAVDPNNAGSLRGVGIGTGIWTIIAPIIALFIGGLATGRMAGPMSGVAGAIHGTVMWSMASIAAVFMLFLTVSAVVRGTVSAGASVASAAAGATSQVAGATSLQALGLSANDLIAPINQRLRSEGKPEVTAQQLTAASQTALKNAVREGRLDKQVFVNSLASQTALSHSDAEQIYGSVSQRFSQGAGQVGDIAQRAQQSALAAAEDAGKVMIGLFGAMALGLAASITGAALGVGRARKRARRLAAAPATEQPVVAP